VPNEHRPGRAVLFDLDGVIVDSREHHIAAWHRFARERQLDHAPDYFTETFGLRNDAILAPLLPGAAPADIDAAAEHKERLFRESAGGRLVALPGVSELLDFLDANRMPKAVVTSTPRPNLDMIVESLGLAGRFDALISAEDTTRGKPDPEGFLAAATRIGMPAAGCVVIEDAPAGLAAAKAAGMRAIGVTTTHPAPDLNDADLVVDALTESRVRTFIFE
jgi:HAD superfamily hydrolase (TIGR01509 family)